jgi:hypothetical protein
MMIFDKSSTNVLYCMLRSPICMHVATKVKSFFDVNVKLGRFCIKVKIG